jgi:hypothetical protein
VKFEEPQLVVVGQSRNIVLGSHEREGFDNSEDNDSPGSLDLGLD